MVAQTPSLPGSNQQLWPLPTCETITEADGLI